MEIGGEDFPSGPTTTQPVSTERDLLAFKVSVSLSGDVAEDVHTIDFDVEIDGAIVSGVLAAGGSVRVDRPVAGDVAASAITLRT